MPPDLSEQQRRNQLDRTQQDKKVLYKLFPLGSIGAFPKHVQYKIVSRVPHEWKKNRKDSVSNKDPALLLKIRNHWQF